MKNKVSANVLIILSIIGILYNILIIAGIIPYQYAWGGRLESYEQMLQLEIMGFIVNAFVIFIVAMRAGYIKQILPTKLITIILWIFTIMFALNTVGNLFALSTFEKVIFTPLTLISIYLFFKLATNKELTTKGSKQE